MKGWMYGEIGKKYIEEWTKWPQIKNRKQKEMDQCWWEKKL